jgi:hypothetical protein
MDWTNFIAGFVTFGIIGAIILVGLYIAWKDGR